MEIKKIFVAGAGLMGSGIAQVCAQTGYEVMLGVTWQWLPAEQE